MWGSPAFEKRRLELSKLYAGLVNNPEENHRLARARVLKRGPIKAIVPAKRAKPRPDGLTAANFPFSPDQAKQRQGDNTAMKIELAGGVVLKLVRIPAGQFVMGSEAGYADEAPRAVVKVAKRFWMGVTEVTNRQYEVFDPKHDTRYLDENGEDHAFPGYIANHPDQPVARVSWQEAMKFCQWLARKSGRSVTLPTEAQWEWAARAGSDKQFFYGDKDTDFSKWANLADAARRRTRVQWDGGSTIHRLRNYPAYYLYPLRDDRFTDKWFVVDYVSQYLASPWGLQDIVGNVNEWTRSSYKSYPYKDGDGRNSGEVKDKKVARGGSWNDRPKTAGSTIRFPFESHQKVYNVGFRVIVEE